MRKTAFSATLLLLCMGYASGNPCESAPKEQLAAQMESLIETIQHHDTLYYRRHSPEISDAEYDALVEERDELSQCLKQTTDTHDGAAPPPESIQHFAALSSLQKGKDNDEVHRFIKSIERLGSPLLLQPKVDGVAAELVYQNGRLVRASTRGDGDWGEDILSTIRAIPAIPTTLDTALARVVIHGEVFARLDRVGRQLKEYASARHFTAAMLHTNTPDKSNLAVLDFFPWHWVGHGWERDSQSHQQLADWGFFDIADYSRLLTENHNVENWRNQLFESQENALFLMDGIVIKADDMAVRRQLGENVTAPHWAMAWKFPAAHAVTVVKDITFTTGRTGKVTPMLLLKPTTLSGISVQQVPVGSVKQLQALDIAPGDLISIALRGAAIPKLNKVIQRSQNRAPTSLPDSSLHSPFTCLRYSDRCHQQFLARSDWFSGKHGLNIQGLSTTTLEQLITRGAIGELADILLLTPEKLTLYSTVNKPQAARIHQSIAEALASSFQRQILSISIPGIGKERAQRLAEHFGIWHRLLQASPEDMASQTILGKKQADVVHRFLTIGEIKTVITLLAPSRESETGNQPQH